MHAARETLGTLLTLLVTPANEPDRAQVGEPIQAVQDVTSEPVKLAFVDQGYTDDAPVKADQVHGIQLEVVNPQDAQRVSVTEQSEAEVSSFEVKFACMRYAGSRLFHLASR